MAGLGLYPNLGSSGGILFSSSSENDDSDSFGEDAWVLLLTKALIFMRGGSSGS